MPSFSSVWVGAVSGAIAGAAVTALLLHSPSFLASRLTNVSVPNGTNMNQSFTATTSSEAAITNVVKEAQPAVVSIVITQDVPVIEQYFDNNQYQDPFGGMFGDMSPFSFRVPQLRQNGTRPQEVGGGSGFLVSADGYIITNKHVVDQQNAQYTVFTNDGKKYSAKVVARDPANDIAVLKIEGTNFSYLQFTTDEVQVGQTAIAIGNALGEFRNTVSVGVVSGLSRSITAGDASGLTEELNEVIQTDAAINPGNSGGPLLSLNGKVIGVNVAVALGSQNIGFALPASSVANVVDEVKTSGKISRAFLGVRYTPITPAVQESNKLSVDYGVLVVRGQNPSDLAVVPGSPADKAGLVEGDVILQADGKKLDDTTSLASIVAGKKVGDTLPLLILHKGEQKTITTTLQELSQ